ncbi:MAG TPA: hypothetical protein VN793_06030, partial [Acidimicrobiales bacterium]|nr:hypothetical protein [Acidimicrobiales bacterium]
LVDVAGALVFIGVLVVLAGLLGGVAMGAVAAARRTQSSYPVYLSSINPSDIQTFTEFAPITGTGYSPRVDDAIARLPYVKRSAAVIGFDGNLQVLQRVNADGPPGEAPPAVEGGLDGEFVTVDRVNLVRGRMADPARADEFVMSAGGAADEGLHIGSTLRLGFFTDAQTASPKFAGYPTDKPHMAVTLKLVGIVEDNFQIVQDDDAALGDQFAVLSPALTRQLADCCAYYSLDALQIEGGAQHQATVVSALNKILPDLGPFAGAQTFAPFIAKAERAIRPEAIAFGVFGLLCALAALLISGQVVGRLVRRNTADASVLRALGAGPAVTAADTLIGILCSVVAGTLLAVALAVALSPLAPIGAVRPVYPDRGIAFDWTVLGFGSLVLVGALSSVAILMAWRESPHHVAHRTGETDRGSRIVHAVAAVGLPPAALTGIRSALGGGSGRDAAPVRSALLGAVLAVVVVVTSITFGASLNSLVSRPALYGWNWNYALLSGFSGAEDLPATETADLLNHDSAIAHWAGVYFGTVQLDGQAIPALAESPNASVSPPLLSGHGLGSAQQVVLGTSTLAMLHQHVGGTVLAGTGRASPVRLRIVGTATLPTIGGSANPDLQMATGAVVSPSLFSAAALNPQDSPIPGPNAVFITIRPGLSLPAALRSLDQVTQVLDRKSDPDSPVGGVVSALRPAEIANYHTVGSTPLLLAGILAAGALGALGLTLVASVRRRQR